MKQKVEAQMKTPITYYGGKQQMVKHILPLITEHKIYTESFFGGGAIFFAKEKSKIETVNDMNGELINFYRVVKEQFPALKKLVSATLHSRKLHNNAWLIYNNADMFDEVKRAWALWVLSTQGFSGQLSNTWGYVSGNSSKNSKCVLIQNKKHQFTDKLAERLEGVQIENHDAIHVIKTYDAADTFHYVDPPYYNSNMGHYGGYTLDDYTRLLTALSNVKGKFLLSSYPSEILDKFVADNSWHQKRIKALVSAAKGTRKEKIEVLTANYPLK